ncbi:serine/threonine-protein phosphatase 4 regulatory subunit 1 isoform X3 [Hemicordylus capensis]|uniref:serine/threonine-protein phosphatase 4 regulatory subunit 1 isoform X3 n=2 Tax=Hemicordylus capensis TaxID=884348 RepID=UPI002303A79C|nr:serine/threonine-protein phosphatase 4 regulatory subunit 1 isoform X3 [Hemicordylus capensis]
MMREVARILSVAAPGGRAGGDRRIMEEEYLIDGRSLEELRSSEFLEIAVGVDNYSSESDVIIIPSALDFVSQDEMLTPLGRLDKYAASENIFNRQMVARSLLDTLKEVSDDERDCIAVLERVSRLADDSEPTVRAELMEQVPHIAMFCQENRPSIPYAFSKYLLPIVVRYLADQNNQVRKTSQAALLVLLEQELIERYDVETKVCPVLVELTAPDSNDEVKTEAVAIMCKMASMVGKDITERLILPRFCEMCCDCRMFHVRKVCAANFGDICSVVGQQATEEMLLPRFFQLCSDNVWGVRKACAECFMAVSCATSQEVRRTKLSTLFINLISDPSRWVRQAAFQSLGPFISTFANPSSSGQFFKEEECKNTEDQNCAEEHSNERLVDMEDSPIHNVQSQTELLPLDADDFAETLENAKEESNSLLVHSQAKTVLPCVLSLESPKETAHENVQSFDHCSIAVLPASPSSSQENSVSEQELYNSFHFWRTPLPEIDIDLELQETAGIVDSETQKGKQEVVVPASSNITMATRKELEEMIENLEPHMDDPDVKAQVEVLSAALRASSLDPQEETAAGPGKLVDCRNELSIKDQLNCNLIQDDTVPLISDAVEDIVESALRYIHNDSDLSTNSSFSPEEEKKSKIQDVVPQALLDQYLSMTDPSRAQTVDTEIAKHCAYSLPGVALTLGRQNWHCLKDTYETLASDMQWKVRRTLAFSIHELAVILGDQLTAGDLVPVFNGFLKDLDEVRIGVLKHLHDFLKLLHPDKRREYLYQLQEFLVTDNSRNWRFRAELAEQLILLLDLYSARDIYDYLRPIALNLCADKVSSVRWISYKLVSEMVKQLYNAPTPTFVVDLMNELVEKFCRCSKWSGRQAFVFICQTIIEDDCLPMDQFAEHLLPHLLHLASDRVPNVRVLLAKTLRQTLLEKEYFLICVNSHQEAVEQTIMALQMDNDSDVKYFASIHPASTKIADDAMSTASSTY